MLNNTAHGPVFGVFAVAVAHILRNHTRWPCSWRYAAAFSAALVVGGLIELVQPVLGRDGQWVDFWTDALGAAGGLATIALVSSSRKWLPGSLLGLAIIGLSWPLVVASLGYVERRRQSPALLELSNWSDWYFLSIQGFDASAATLPQAWRKAGDPTSIRLQLTAEPMPVIVHSEPMADWHNYDLLMVDLTNPGPDALHLVLRVHDGRHNNLVTDRFNRRMRLEPGTRSVFAIPLVEVVHAPHGRSLDLAAIAGWMIFARGDAILAGREFYLTRIWLE